MKIKIDKDNGNMAVINGIRLSFTRPIKTIKTVKCRICNELGDLIFCAEHIKNNKEGHFEKGTPKNALPYNSSRRAFDIIEYVV